MSFLPINAESLSSVKGRAQRVLGGFTLGQKVLTILMTAALIGAALLFIQAESKPSYQVLFTNLQPSDSGAVVSALTTAKIPYQLSNNGATVSVPASKVDSERVALAQQGLPSSGTVGFSTLEKGGFTTSQFVQQVEYQQALEGQLAQTIESIQGIQSAQVNLVVPQQSAFAIGTQQSTTASILVDLAPGVTLTNSQVQGIVHLTASAVPNLTASNVTVVDNQGEVLSSSNGAGGSSSSSQASETTAYDNQLASSIQALLTHVVGIGNAAVQVHAVLNFNQQKTVTTGIQTGANGKPLSVPTTQSTSKQTTTGTGTPAAGVIGANQPPVVTNGKYTSNTTSSKVTNAVGQITQTIQQAPGQVVQTSVAVIVNSNTKPKPNQAQIQSLVTAAAGLNLAKGDKLVVSAMPFAAANTSALNSAAKAAAAKSLYEHIAEGVGLVLLLAVMLFLTLRASKRSIYEEVTPIGVGGPTPSMLAQDTVQIQAIPLNANAESVVSQVQDRIVQRPTEVAQMLKKWAREGDEIS